MPFCWRRHQGRNSWSHSTLLLVWFIDVKVRGLLVYPPYTVLSLSHWEVVLKTQADRDRTEKSKHWRSSLVAQFSRISTCMFLIQSQGYPLFPVTVSIRWQEQSRYGRLPVKKLAVVASLDMQGRESNLWVIPSDNHKIHPRIPWYIPTAESLVKTTMVPCMEWC